jgi:hypothetical protein
MFTRKPHPRLEPVQKDFRNKIGTKEPRRCTAMRERMRLTRFSRPTRRTVSLQSVGNLWAPAASDIESPTDLDWVSLCFETEISQQVLSVQHGVNCRREESQISEPGDATIREKAPNPFHLIRREAVSFANLKTFVPYSPFGRSLFGHGFSLRRLVSAHSPRHRGRPNVGFTIVRIIWQGAAS